MKIDEEKQYGLHKLEKIHQPMKLKRYTQIKIPY